MIYNVKFNKLKDAPHDKLIITILLLLPYLMTAGVQSKIQRLFTKIIMLQYIQPPIQWCNTSLLGYSFRSMTVALLCGGCHMSSSAVHLQTMQHCALIPGGEGRRRGGPGSLYTRTTQCGSMHSMKVQRIHSHCCISMASFLINALHSCNCRPRVYLPVMDFVLYICCMYT